MNNTNETKIINDKIISSGKLLFTNENICQKDG